MKIATEERHLTARLTARYPDVPPELIEDLVEQEFGKYEDAAVQAFLPILVERAVGRQLHR